MAYNVLVIGERCLDRFTYGDCIRLSPEAPVPVFKPRYETANLGMAANVCANLEAFKGGIEITFITNHEMPTKTRLVDDRSNQMLLRMDENDEIIETAVLNNVVWGNHDCVVVSDYAKGFLSIQDLIHISQSHPLTFLDTKKPVNEWTKDFTFVKINEEEWINSNEYYAGNLIVTMGRKGAYYRGTTYPAEKVEVMDVSGAGDTFLAALVYKYLQTECIKSAIHFANECSGNVISKRGVSTI